MSTFRLEQAEPRVGATTGPSAQPAPVEQLRRRPSDVGYVLAVAIGALCIGIASWKQPYNQNELLQMAPYGSDRISTIISGTRQPPLDPLLGSLIQHALGVGQLRQRLEPALSAIGTLAAMAFLLRRSGLRWPGVFAMALMATAPLFVRYAAYTRPYALPLFLMMIFVIAGQLWLETGRKWWLILMVVSAVTLPLSRVTEPTAWLVTTAITLAVLAWRGRIAWGRAGPVIGVCALALTAVGYPMVHSLRDAAPGLWDPSPAGIAARFGTGAHELLTGFLPLMAEWIPMWPLLLCAMLAAASLREARRLLATWWFFWPLLVAPIAFALAYHFTTTVNLWALPYRPRAAYFFVPAMILIFAAVAAGINGATKVPTWARTTGIAALLLALVGQLPSTWGVMNQPDEADFKAAGELLARQVPSTAAVIYDRPTPVGAYRREFLAPNRYLTRPDQLIQARALARHPGALPVDAPLYLLVNTECVNDRCRTHAQHWAPAMEGWQVLGTVDRFTLYGPTADQHGPVAAADLLRQLGALLGPQRGYVDVYAAAALQHHVGHVKRAQAILAGMFSATDEDLRRAIMADAARKQLVFP